MRRAPVAPCLIVVGALAACSGGESGGALAIRIADLPVLAYAEEARIGSFDDPVVGFSQIGDVEAGPDGAVYVSELQASEVRIYAADGTLLRTVGRAGEGPGEFARPTSIGLLGDTLWVRDSRRRRISWFGPDGALVHETPGTSLSVESDIPGMSINVLIGDPRDDGFVGSTRSIGVAGGAADRPYFVPRIRFDRDGNVVDTLRWDTIDPGPTVRIEGSAMHPPSLHPSSPLVVRDGDDRFELAWAVATESDRGTLEAVRTTAGGDTLARASLAYDPIPLPGSVRDSLLEPLEGLGSVFGFNERAFQSAMASGLDLPEHRPPVRSAERGRAGEIWIELNEARADSTAWLLLDPDLTPRGRVVLPSSMSPKHIAGSTAWVIDTDEFDVPWLVRVVVR